ncbi:cob(I)yrinic acid a,c-diamide adenosyltransferase [Williamsoniiplasma lucivorax]|uniref:Cobalamin adenosyltransferase n=1 Tax=Williamsoniiplasma lucivorax TaxID=209274 RepID=A0A2S5REV2_9MOLU|nr:cob(I)yrinic acid a,c-diamide adenosyltransferase [Williamsoniiplasma lucivorax]PPE05856.1 cobalamin adenosyltransferase [Williamsoniiplasma lucivorax]
MEKGYIQIYCGEGKGKTSVLNGMVLRALGAGKTIDYVRFLKNRPTSENIILEKLGIHIKSFYHFSTKFVWEMDPKEVETFKHETLQGYEYFKNQLKNENLDILLADEILGAVQNGFINKHDLVEALKNKSTHLEVAMSGRYSFPELNQVAHLISEIKPIKHYLDEGVIAREGIEF